MGTFGERGGMKESGVEDDGRSSKAALDGGLLDGRTSKQNGKPSHLIISQHSTQR